MTIKPFGERAVLLEWPTDFNESMLHEMLRFVAYLKKLDLSNWEMSLAYNSLTLVNTADDIDFEQTKNLIFESYTKSQKEKIVLEQSLWKIPVCYDMSFGIDIAETAEKLGLSVEKLIELHTSSQYILYGIGFLPGFMYLGGLPSVLEIDRRATPRLDVAKGSVGLAGKQTGIYPQDSPGGWNVIGRCPISIFNPKLEQPCFVKVGDKIQFVQISKAEYDLRKIEAEVGIYKPEKMVLDA